jgi:AcrR family transcriptional regulator
LSGVGQTRTRLPAHERRQAILEAAQRVFAGGSYSGSTTAEIAREAGVSEPILYRHFASKRDLYLACLGAAWESLRTAFDAKVDELGEREAVTAIGLASREFHASGGIKPVTLWIQALTEAGEDEEIRNFLRVQLREVHDYVAAAVRRAQAAGGVPADRDPDAEAWIFVGAALLLSFADRLGGLLGPDEFGRMASERRRWLTGNG